jgi:predicted RNA-binding protein YlxR (DUF448 family)
MPGSTQPGAQTGKPAKKARQPQRPRHVPQRTCAACRAVRPKRELLRVVRTPQGHVELDATGKKAGRGTYLCARRECWDAGLRKGRLEHEFALTLSPEDRAALEAYAATLPADTPPAPAPAPRRKKAPPAESAGAG